MKRVMLVVAAVALILSGYVAGGGFWRSVDAQDDRVIPVFLSRYMGDVGTVGDPCSVPLDLQFFPGSAQVTVRNESNVVIAIQTLEGVIELSSSGSNFCKGQISIPVPDADFYVVYFGEERVVGYSASQFPISDNDGVWISPD